MEKAISFLAIGLLVCILSSCMAVPQQVQETKKAGMETSVPARSNR